MNPTLLDGSGLRIYYNSPRGDVKAVDEVNFRVGESEIVGLAGESGSGKSTLALGVMRLVNPPGRIADGEVKFEGVDILHLGEEEFRTSFRWKKIAMVFQGSMNGFTPVFTVGSQMEEVLKIHGYTGERAQKVRDLLDLVNLEPSIAQRYPHELSGGQKQRAFIAMALALAPKLLIADEPTTALDVITQANILNLLKKLRKELGISILLITHDLALISEAADTLYIMYAGRIAETGPSDEVFRNPKHPYTQRLLLSTPTMSSQKISGIPGFMPDLANVPAGCSFNPRCPRVFDVCLKERPELRKTNSGEDEAACWLY
jgi:peptide/nickel transport system ATP-binding protein